MNYTITETYSTNMYVLTIEGTWIGTYGTKGLALAAIN